MQIDDAGTNPNGFGVGTLIVFGYSFLLASFVLFLVKEKESKVCGCLHTIMCMYVCMQVLSSSLLFSNSITHPFQAKHIQFVSGVHSTSYWLASLAWDLLNAAVPVIISFLLIAAFNIPEFRGTTLAAVLLLLVCMLKSIMSLRPALIMFCYCNCEWYSRDLCMNHGNVCLSW